MLRLYPSQIESKVQHSYPSEPLLPDPEGGIEAQAGVEAVSIQIKSKVQHSFYLSRCYLILKAGLRPRLVLRLYPPR